jgi:hypothetical protein
MMESTRAESILSNIINSIYSLSKLPSAREYLLSNGAERILSKIAQIDNAKLKNLASKTLKNLSADVSETIEEGAVASLIAMSLEVMLNEMIIITSFKTS